MTNKNKVENKLTVSISNINSLEFTLKPLVALFTLIGLHIPLNKHIIINPNHYGYGRRRFWILCLFGCILLLSHISYWIHKSFVHFSISNDQALKKSNNQTSSSDGGQPASMLAISARISIMISLFNDIGYFVTIHLSIFITIWLLQFNWKLLWINLKEIEININLDTQFYHRTAKMCRIFILLLLGHSIFFAVRDSVSKYVLGLNDPYWFLFISANMSHFIIDAILTMFYVLVSCSVDLLALLNRRVKALVISSNFKQINDTLLGVELEKWRHHHILVCQLIEHINKCFGLIILSFIGYSFVSFIACCYLMYDNIASDKNNDFLVPSTELLQKSIQMFTFIGVCVKIKSETGKLSHMLFLLASSANQHTQLLVNAAIMQVNHWCPKIRAMNFFDVDSSLYISLISSTLTYCIILGQAKN